MGGASVEALRLGLVSLSHRYLARGAASLRAFAEYVDVCPRFYNANRGTLRSVGRGLTPRVFSRAVRRLGEPD
jgi:hypothetical protein